MLRYFLTRSFSVCLMVLAQHSGQSGLDSYRAITQTNSKWTVDVHSMFKGCNANNSTQAKQYVFVNLLMHVGMSINFTGNTAYDFISGMIPHHAGASRMCEVYKTATSSDQNMYDK